MPDKPNDNKESWISRLTGVYARIYVYYAYDN